MSTSRTLDRRRFLLTSVAALAAGPALAAPADPFAASPFRKLTPAQWKARLSPAAFAVLREAGTERAGASPLLAEHRKGRYVCAGCDLPLFDARWKYESGTGWPSFYTAIKGALGKKTDYEIGYARTEYHCARCLGHQGHIFDDGPQPTGLRYCNNGVALKLVAA